MGTLTVCDDARATPGKDEDMQRDGGKIGLPAAISMGVGSMIGAGIFSIIGIAAAIAGSALPLSFAIAGVVALLCAYSYARLGVRYPSSGGSVEYLLQGFGDGRLIGGITILLWIGYVFALALYARAFGSYAAALIWGGPKPLATTAFAAGVLAAFTLVNFVGSRAVGRAELLIVAIKVGILLVFAAAGLSRVQPALLAISTWPRVPSILYGAAVVFLAYEGFSLINNATLDMHDFARTLPRALFGAVGIVIAIYLLVSLALFGNLPVPGIVAAKDYALAAAARPFLGKAGFTLIAVAALFSTASAINATLYGGANVSYALARDGELPPMFDRKLWRNANEGLFITAGVAIVAAVLLPLQGIALLGSTLMLFVYDSVAVAHARVIKETGASRAVVYATITACSVTIAVLVFYIARTSLPSLITLGALFAASFVAETLYRRFRPRVIKSHVPAAAEPARPR